MNAFDVYNHILLIPLFSVPCGSDPGFVDKSWATSDRCRRHGLRRVLTISVMLCDAGGCEINHIQKRQMIVIYNTIWI